MPDLLAQEQLARYNDLKATRDSLFMPTWQSISQYFWPAMSSINVQKMPGNVTSWFERVYATEPILAARTLASGQRNWLTPSSEPWFAYEVPEFLSGEGREEEKDEATQWLSRATEIAVREVARSNFYAMMNVDYEQCGVFGTGMLFVEEGKKTALNFRQFAPWVLTIEEDDEGIVDSVHREFTLTTRQAVQMFGVANVGPKITKAFQANKLSEKWKFLHACFPRDDSKRIRGARTPENKPIASIYIAVDDEVCVQVGGYDEMPYLCSRFASWGADTCWGVSPAYLVLPEARQLNYVTQYTDALAELKAYPRFLYPENLEGDVDLRAGGVTTYDPSVQDGKPSEWATVGDKMDAEEQMARKIDAINRAFYVNMFTMLEQLADKKMTAYEIAQRLGEKLEQFTPVFDRRVTEFLNPLLLRVFGLLFRQGKFGEPPQSLLVPAGDGYALATPKVAITSRISMALKALQNTAIVNTLSVLQPLAQTDPAVLDNFDMDAMSRDLGRNYGVSPQYLVPMKRVREKRAARAQQQAQEMAADMAQRLTSSAKDLNAAPAEIKDAVTEQFVGNPVPTG